MEGLNYLCLGAYLCIVAIIVGGIAFIPLRLSTKAIITKKYGEKYNSFVVPIALTIVIILSCILFYTAYAPAFPGYYTPQRRPNPQDIIGVWTPTADTLERMQERGYSTATHTLEFRENGDFIMTDMHDIIFWRDKIEYYSGVGKWSAEKDFQGYWVINIVFSSLAPPYYPDPPLSGPTPCPGKSVPCDGLRFTFYLLNRKPPYTLKADIGAGELGPNFYFYRDGDIHEP